MCTLTTMGIVPGIFRFRCGYARDRTTVSLLPPLPSVDYGSTRDGTISVTVSTSGTTFPITEKVPPLV